ncbi:hypothetical protein M5D96_002486 [Drosophila gunungcola]|uniref:Uncharacterized protein n=1 Tax=Drosophila gunungcola TaxID=103775 RepID=A0A9P9Z050_9MUSC|nr:hypothetical protein M5D96_002486 [Drosophila gunungcola]
MTSGRPGPLLSVRDGAGLVWSQYPSPSPSPSPSPVSMPMPTWMQPLPRPTLALLVGLSQELQLWHTASAAVAMEVPVASLPWRFDRSKCRPKCHSGRVQCECDHEWPRTECRVQKAECRSHRRRDRRSELQPQECEPGVGVLAVRPGLLCPGAELTAAVASQSTPDGPRFQRLRTPRRI